MRRGSEKMGLRRRLHQGCIHVSSCIWVVEILPVEGSSIIDYSIEVKIWHWFEHWIHWIDVFVAPVRLKREGCNSSIHLLWSSSDTIVVKDQPVVSDSYKICNLVFGFICSDLLFIFIVRLDTWCLFFNGLIWFVTLNPSPVHFLRILYFATVLRFLILLARWLVPKTGRQLL